MAQVYDLQQLYLKKAYNTLNGLLVFLYKNRASLPFWKESEAEKQRQRLFVRTPSEFGEYFDIKGSFALFLSIAPDMLAVQRSIIKDALERLYATEKKQEHRLVALRKEIGLTKQTTTQLLSEKRNLQVILKNTQPNTPQWKKPEN